MTRSTFHFEATYFSAKNGNLQRDENFAELKPVSEEAMNVQQASNRNHRYFVYFYLCMRQADVMTTLLLQFFSITSLKIIKNNKISVRGQVFLTFGTIFSN